MDHGTYYNRCGEPRDYNHDNRVDHILPFHSS